MYDDDDVKKSSRTFKKVLFAFDDKLSHLSKNFRGDSVARIPFEIGTCLSNFNEYFKLVRKSLFF